MDIRFTTKGKREIVMVDDARITFRNFSGRGDQYNREGDRNFSLIIPTQELADELIEAGLNVKIRAPRDAEDKPFMHLKIKVNMDSRRPPVAYLRTPGKTPRKLDADTIGLLDDVDIASVDLDFNVYEWNRPDGSGRSAYLESICVTQEVDRFAERYAEEEYPED